MTQPCDCCEGTESLTPESNANRPGLDALRYRIGRHATFLESMKAAISRSPLLKGLQTREPNDPSIAFLDAWATVGDVLTFYQERIANEGYLRTATERLSVLELARLVGYQAAPGVAASVYLAFQMEDKAEGEIPAGTRVQSLPGPGELPQSFETSYRVSGRGIWNEMKVRRTRPQRMLKEIIELRGFLYFKGIATGLQVGAPLLIDYTNGDRVLYRVMSVTAEPTAKRTRVRFQPWEGLLLGDFRTWFESLQNVPIGFRGQFNLGKSMPDDSFVTEKNIHDAKELADKLKFFDTSLQTIDRFVNRIVTLLQPVAGQEKDPEKWDAIPMELTRLGKNLSQFDGESVRIIRERLDILNSCIVSLIQSQNQTNPESFEWERVKEELGILGRLLPTAPDQRAALIQFVELVQQIDRKMRAKGYADEPRFTAWMIEQADLISRTINRLTIGASDFNQQAQSARLIQDGEYGIANAIDWVFGGVQRLAPAVLGLQKTPSIQPRSPQSLRQEQPNLLRGTSDAAVKALTNYLGQTERGIYQALTGTPSVSVGVVKVYTFGVKASLFGHNALNESDVVIPPPPPPSPPTEVKGQSAEETKTAPDTEANAQVLLPLFTDWDRLADQDDDPDIIWLDNAYEKIAPGSPLILLKAGKEPLIRSVESVQEHTRSAYRVSGKSSRIQLPAGSWQARSFTTDIRGTTVLTQAQVLELDEMPVLNALAPDQIELDIVADGLEAGRWVIVAGERIDLGSAAGVRGAELAMIAQVEHLQDQALAGDRTVTWLTFAAPLSFQFKPESVVVYGNVVKATHGETRSEVLGSGDASKTFQSFKLAQAPLTWVADSTAPRGARSSLELRVNDLLWDHIPSLTTAEPTDRVYTLMTDDEDKTSVVFGDGEYGARPSTGSENVRAKYRVGIGKVGNVKAEQISLLATRPLGVKGVINPLRATGGADREVRDQIRRNASIGTRSLGRIVSVEDYADFARTFAGIAKAHAIRLPNGSTSRVLLTIAGADDAAIDPTSDLYQNLVEALQLAGDPYQHFAVLIRELLVLTISANILPLPDYDWDVLKPRLQARLLDTFSFDRRALGQDVTRSEVIRTLQTAPGVAYVDLEFLDSINESRITTLAHPQAGSASDPNQTYEPRLQHRIVAELPSLRRQAPAQLAYLRPDLAETLVLNRIMP